MNRHGWTYKKLGDICCNITDGSHNPPKGIEHSQYKMISSQNIFDDKIIINNNNVRYLSEEDYEIENKRTNIKKGVVLLTIVGTIGRSCVVKGDEGLLTLQRSVAALTPCPNINPRYLMHSLIGNRDKLNNEAHGIAQKGLYLKKLSSLSIPVPSIKEQEAIVAELDEINEAIEALQKQVADLDTLTQSTFFTMFGDQLQWDNKPLKDVTYNMGSGATPRGGNQSYKDEGISLIRSLNVYNGYFKRKDLAHIDEIQAAQLNNVVVEENDVLLNITGASVARCCIVPSDILPARVNQHVSILRPNDDLVNHVFLCHYLISDTAQGQLLLLSKSKAATREALPKAVLEKFLIPLPPLSLQQDFVAKVEAIESAKSEINSQITEMQTLLASRMDYYFD